MKCNIIIQVWNYTNLKACLSAVKSASQNNNSQSIPVDLGYGAISASLPKTTSADSWWTCLLAVAIDLRVTIDPMNARIIIAAVGALIIAGTLTECLDQDEHNIAGCLRACGWDEHKTLTKRARVSCLFLFHLHRNFHVMVKSAVGCECSVLKV